MKHLKKFNESIESEILQNARDIMQELKDDKAFIIHIDEVDDKYIRVSISYKGPRGLHFIKIKYWFSKIKEYILSLIDYMYSEDFNYKLYSFRNVLHFDINEFENRVCSETSTITENSLFVIDFYEKKRKT